MKRKLLSLFLAFSLLLTVLPFYVLAEEDKPLSREEHLALACEIFPEYADLISGTRTISTYLQRSTEPEVVFSETRNLSDTYQMTLIEYSDGETVIISNNTTYISKIQSASGAGISYYVVDFLVTMEGSTQQFIVENAKFTINYNDYDFITSKGDFSNSTTSQKGGEIKQAYENASGDAWVQYSAEFARPGQLPLTPEINFRVGGNWYTFDDN